MWPNDKAFEHTSQWPDANGLWDRLSIYSWCKSRLKKFVQLLPYLVWSNGDFNKFQKKWKPFLQNAIWS